MQVLDVLVLDLHGDLVKLELGGYEDSFCYIMLRKTRSTSAASCKIPIQGDFDDILIGLHTAPAVGSGVLDRLVGPDRQSKGLAQIKKT